MSAKKFEIVTLNSDPVIVSSNCIEKKSRDTSNIFTIFTEICFFHLQLNRVKFDTKTMKENM